jgi:hypothetical protein
MLRSTFVACSKPVSKQYINRGNQKSASFGHRYDKTTLRLFANGGWGMGTYTSAKDRRWKTPTFVEDFPVGKPANMGMSNTTKTLSPEWRPFALDDGGVLFVHPTRDDVMQWNQQTLVKEREASGMASRDNDTVAKIQALIADNTLEHISLARWRRTQLRSIIRRQTGVRLGGI